MYNKHDTFSEVKKTMLLKKWDNLPDGIRKEEVRKYYDILAKKKASLFFKRFFDFVIALLLSIILLPFMLIIGICIVIDSKGGMFFTQTRVTQYGRRFKILKFRTMVSHAENFGSQVTVDHDSRVTKVGHFLRKTRLDELPQLFNILKGDMSFVGTRPEVVKYVEQYTPEMMATLLLPAGITSLTSIKFKDEEQLLSQGSDVDKTYIQVVLPKKMEINLEYIEKFNLFFDLKVMIKTVFAVI